MRRFLSNLRGALGRVFPQCLAQGQAVAFSMFLSFFPMVLLALGVFQGSERMSAVLDEFLFRLRWILPPGSRSLVGRPGVAEVEASRLVLVGLWGTLLIGTQTMTGLLDGIRMAHGRRDPAPFWQQQARGFLLLCATLIPFLMIVVLTVFGKQVRTWMINQFGLPMLFNAAWFLVYLSLALVFAVIVLSALYRAAWSDYRGWNQVFPGAVLATVLWWVVNSGFGIYVRRVPYNLVYGGLAAAIGLMIWMYVSVVVVFIGAGYNAEELHLRPARRATDPPGAAGIPADDASADTSRPA